MSNAVVRVWFFNNGPGMGLPWCMDGLGKGVVSMCMGQMWCLLW